MAWLEIHQTLRDHRKTYEAADALDVKPVTMMGMLVSLWLWAIDNVPDGDISGIRPRTIARAAQWDGDPEELIEALVDNGWLDRDEESLVIHDWYEYAGKLIDRREAEKERSRRRRQKKDKPQGDQETTTGQPPVNQQATEENPAAQYSTVQYSTNKEIDSKESKGDEPPEPPADLPADREPVPYKKIQELYIGICLSFPKIMAINGQRKKAVGARWNEHKDIKVFEELFRKAEASSFMKGHNDRNWTADFDWMMKPTNFSKILEGRYDDKGGGTGSGINSKYSESEGKNNTRAEETPTLTGFRMATDPAGKEG